MPTLNDLLFSERRILTVPSGNSNNISYAMTALRNLEDLGFTIDQEGITALASASKKDIEDWYFDTAEKLNELVGNNHEYRPFYPNFPNELMEKTDLEKYTDQLCHYWFGYMPEGEDEKKNIRSMEEHPVKVLRTVHTERDVRDLSRNIFQNLLASKQNLSETERKNVLAVYADNVDDWAADATVVTNRKNLGFLYAKAIVDGKDLRGLPPMVTGDVLRLSKYLTLIKQGAELNSVNFDEVDQVKVKSLPRSQRRMLCALLEKQKNLGEDVMRDKNQWKAVFNMIHPGEFANYRHVNEICDALRNGDRMGVLKTYYSRVEEAYQKEDMDKVLKLYKQRPGEMIKNINRLCKFAVETHKENELLKALEETLKETRVEDLITLDQYLNARGRENYLPAHNVKGQLYIPNKEVSPIDNTLAKTIQAMAKDAIIQQFIKNDIGNKEAEPDKVYIEPGIEKMALPSNRKESSDSMNLYTKGSKFDIEKDEKGQPKNLRAFIWWTNQENGRVDIDLSGAFFKEVNGNLKDEARISYFTSGRVLGCTHSGDITNGGDINGKGVAEYIDFNLESLREHNIDYVQVYVNAYAGDTFDKLNCLFGWQERGELDRSAQFDPRAVAQTSKLSSQTKGTTPIIIDVKKGEIIWTDTPDFEIKTAQNIQRGSLQTKMLMQRYGYGDRMSMKDMMDLCVRATGGEFVEDKEKANIVVTINPEKEVREGAVNITAKEQDRWLGIMSGKLHPDEPEKSLERENDIGKTIMDSMYPPKDTSKEKDNIHEMRDKILDMIHEEMGESVSLEQMSSHGVIDFKNIADDIKERENEIRSEYFEKYGFESFAANVAVEEMKEKEYHRYPGLRDYMEGRTNDAGARDDVTIPDRNNNGIDDRIENEEISDPDIDEDDLEL